MSKLQIRNKLLLERLEELAQRLDITVTYEKGLESPGGFCRMKDQKMIMINKDLTVPDRIDILADLLCGFSLDTMYILPEVREYLECLQEKKIATHL